MAFAGLLGLVLLGIQSLDPGLLPNWDQSQWLPVIELASVFWALLYFVAWKPYCRHEDQQEGHRREIVEMGGRIAKIEESVDPKFELLCQTDVEACVLSRPREGFHLFRLLVKNLSASQGVTDCKVRLKSVHRGATVVVKHVIWDLPESNARKIAGVTILGGQEGSWDLLCVQTNTQPQQVHLPNGNGNVSALTDKNGDSVFKEFGEYILSIEVYAAGPSRSGQIKFKWTGDSNNSEISTV